MKQVIPLKKLGELFAFKNGRAFKKEEWATKGLPIIRIQNLNNVDAPFNYFQGEYSNDILIEPGDLLFSWSGTVGSSFGPHIWDREKGVLNQHIFKIALKSEITKLYAYHALRYITEEIEKSVNGAVGLVHITKEKLNEFVLPVPSLPEQQRIVGILDKAFEGIATAKTNAEKNLQNARALFDSHIKSIFAQVSERWGDHTQLEDLTDPKSPITYGVVKPGDEGEVTFIRGGDLSHGRILTGQLRTITQAISEQYKRTLLKGGELLISLVGQPGQVAVVPPELVGANIARQVGLIRIQARMNVEFVRFFLQSPGGQAALGARQSGSVQQVINLGELRQVRVPTPPINVQNEVVKSLDTAAEEIQSLECIYQQKLGALKELKKSLLHQAFSGQL